MYKNDIKIIFLTLIFAIPMLKTYGESYQLENSTIDIQSAASQVEAPVIKNNSYEVVLPEDDSKNQIELTASSLNIDYGNIKAGEPIIRNEILNISKNINRPLYVYIRQDHTLQSDNGTNEIPTTHCDNGACTDQTPGIWINPLTYGYGYRCEKSGEIPCRSEFNDKWSFLAIYSDVQKYSPMYFDINKSENINFIFQVNVSPTASNLQYHNSLTLTLLPKI